MGWNDEHDTFHITATQKQKVSKYTYIYIAIAVVVGIISVVFYYYKDSFGKSLTFKQIDYVYPVKYLKVDNKTGNIAYIDQGSGKFTLLFIHGVGNYLKYFVPQIKVLRKKFRCIALDMPGYGKSTFKQNLAYSLSFHAKSIIKFINTLKLKNVVLIGHSYGGMVATEIASILGKRIKRLVLISPVGLKKIPDKWIEIYSSVLTERAHFAVDDMRKSFKKGVYKSTDLTDKYKYEAYALVRSGAYKKNYITRIRVFKSILKVISDFHWKFAYLDMRILVIGGEYDRIAPLHHRIIKSPMDLGKKRDEDDKIPSYHQRDFSSPEFYKSLEQKNGKCNVKIIKNCGHFAVIEKPDKVNALILDFLVE